MRKQLFYILLLLFPVILKAQVEDPTESEDPIIEFSLEGGFFEDSLMLQLRCADAEIYFTIDGQKPRERSSMRYSSPIPINHTTVVRAIAVKGSGKSLPISQTYFIGEPPTNFAVVSLAIPPDDLFNPLTGMFVKGDQAIDTIWSLPGANFWSRSEIDINTEIFEADGTCVFRSGTGFRLFGGMSRLFPQKSMTLITRGRYGDSKIDYPIFGSAGKKKFKYLVLRNSGSDFGKSHFRDAFMTGLTEGMGIETQDYRPAQVYINGQYWGIYNIREKVNRDFVEAHNDVDKDSIDLLEHRYNRKRGSKSGYLRLLHYLENHDLSDPVNYAYIESQIDVDNFMNYQIAQIYFDNQDAGGNIKYWRPQKPDGKWRWILYDTDWGFGLHDPVAYQNNSLLFHTAADGPSWPNPPWSTFILRKLLENPDFQRKFVTHFADFLNTNFSEQRALAGIDYFESLLRPEIPRHIVRWNLSYKVWEEQLVIMRNFARQRPEFVRMHLMERFDLGRQRAFSLKVSSGGKVLLNEHLEIREEGYSGQYFEKLPVRIQAIPERGYRFSHWKGLDLTDTDLSLELTRDYELEAVFEPYNHPLAGMLMVNEINCNDKQAGDWIELYNFSNEKITLDGWILADSKHQFLIPTISIPPKDYLVICQDAAKFESVYPEAYRYVGDMKFGLNKRKESISLFTGDGAYVDHFSYNLAPQDSIFSLNLLLPQLDNANQANWEMLIGTASPDAANTYYVQSTLKERRDLWLQIGGAFGVIILCISLLVLRHRGSI
ncbi:MAG: CotH kinase family protein [Saprospiraceae bacterium]|nr:CotH kinase family protein [Saprospiraceae bacterium]